MKYLIKGHLFEADPSLKLGAGSEGSVFAIPGHQNACVKLFHPPDRGDREAEALAKYRAKKIEKITSLGLQMQQQFILPKNAAYDEIGRNIIGFSMSKVQNGNHKLMKLLDQQFRIQYGFGLRDIVSLFSLSYADLMLIHKQGLVIGDFNMGCMMFDPKTYDRAWVDTDSWSYKDYPCIATTEMFAHPDLYANLIPGGKMVEPKDYHDRFALTVAFTMIAVHGAHPFKQGKHPKYSGLQERAKNGITIFDSDVNYPKFLPNPEILSDELLDKIINILKRKTDDSLDPKFLEQFAKQVIDCKSCGAQYHASRKHCPACHEKTTVDFSSLLTLLVEELFKIHGSLLWVQVINNRLFAVINNQDKIEIFSIDSSKRNFKIESGLNFVKGAKYKFFGNSVAVCEDPYSEKPIVEIYEINGQNFTYKSKTTTGILEGDAALIDSSEKFLYRTAGNSLMCGRYEGKLFLEERVAQVHHNQSWFTVNRQGGMDKEIIFGYDRALNQVEYSWFVIQGDSSGNHFSYHEVNLPKMRSQEKLENFAVYFRKDSVLLVRKTKYHGKMFVRYTVIGLNGEILVNKLLKDTDEGFVAWENINGKLFQAKSILHVTSEGIVKQDIDSDTYSELKDTHGIITGSDRLFMFDKTIGVARRDGILTIKRK